MSAPRLNFPYGSGGGGGGGVSGSGTANTIPMWTAASTLGDSAISQVAGAIQTLTLTNAGAGATNGTYSQQALTGGTGTGATADIVVALNVVTVLILRSPGTGYTAGDTLSCATIGGGGFVFTVSSVSASDNGSGNVTAARIGAGTTTPIGQMESKGLLAVTASGRYGLSFPGAPSSSLLYKANSVITSDGEPTGQMVLADTDSIGAGSLIALNADASALTAGKNAYAAVNRALLTNVSAAGGVFLFGSLNTAQVSTPTMSGKTGNTLIGSSNVASIGGTAGSNTFTTLRASSHNAAATTAAAQTITTVEVINQTASFQNAAHAIGTFYAIRLNAPSVTGGATITNRFGISQEDTLATNQFSATTNTFSGVVRATGTSATAPAFSTPGDTNTGMYFPSADTVRIAAGANIGMEVDPNGVFGINNGFGSIAPTYGCRAWVNFDSTVSGTWAGGASTVTRVAGSTTATVTTTNNHGLITGNSVYALSGVAVGYYTITYVGPKTFTITTVATTALSAVPITFAVNNIRASGGVSSVTDISTGIFSVNFSTAMPDVNYSAVGTKQNVATNSAVSLYDCFAAVGAAPARTTTQCGWQCIENAAAADSPNVNIAVFR